MSKGKSSKAGVRKVNEAVTALAREFGWNWRKPATRQWILEMMLILAQADTGKAA